VSREQREVKKEAHSRKTTDDYSQLPCFYSMISHYYLN
jgi:hypothetical protein